MQASAWKDAASAKIGKAYGIRVGIPNRDEFFHPSWTTVEIEIDGRFHCFELTGDFWNKCPEIRDGDKTIIRDWLHRKRSLTWPKGDPPKLELVPLGSGRFRLLA